MATAVQPQLQHIPIDKIKVASNVRHRVSDLDELVLSIQTFGVIQPLAVRPENGHFIVIAGHRRLAAATTAGLKDVPCLVREDLVDAAFLTAQLVENLQRVDLDPLEEADGYRRLVDLGLKQKDIAAKVGRSEGHVSKRLALIDLPKDVHDRVTAGKLTIVDALELAPYAKDPEVIQETLKHVDEAIRNRWAFRVSDHARGAVQRVEARRKRDAAIERLKAAKVTIVKGDNDYSYPRGVTLLGKGYAELPISPSEHSKSPCHAAWIRDSGEVNYVCTKLDSHKASTDPDVKKALATIARDRSYNSPSRGDAKAGKEQAKKAAASRERNKVLRVREPLRVAELKRLLTAKQKREDVLDFTLRNLLQLLVSSDYEVGERAAAYLEIPMSKKSHTYDRANPEFAAYLAGGSDRLFKLAYAFALASGEAPFAKLLSQGYFDQEYSTNATRYLDHMAANGYKPDKVELAQLPKSENGYRWRDAFDVVKPVKAKKK